MYFKGWNLKQIWYFESTCLLTVVSWSPLKDMAVSKLRKPSIFSKGESESLLWTFLRKPSIFSKGESESLLWTFLFIDGECREMGSKTREAEGDANLLSLNFMCCYLCLPNFQCFWSCVPWTHFCIFCYVSHAAFSGTYPWVASTSPS